MSIIDFIEQIAVQTAVYWAAPKPDGYGGTIYSDPVEIACRWEDTTKLIISGSVSQGGSTVGGQIVCKAEIMVAGKRMPDGSIEIIDFDLDGRLYLGSLDDLDSSQYDDPSTLQQAYPIVRFDKSPLFQSTDEFIRTVYL